MISVLLPSRCRPVGLEKAIRSLLENAVRPQEVQILVAVDDDDLESGLLAVEYGCDVWTTPRLGYPRLHEYYNQLSKMATGDWLLLWNDDAVMLTEAWDMKIRAHAHPSVLRLESNHSPNLCPFPAVSASIVKAVGHFSLSPHCDSWVHEVGMEAGVYIGIPVAVRHERFDLTGDNHDQTFYESQAGYRPDEFNGPELRAARSRDAQIVRSLRG